MSPAALKALIDGSLENFIVAATPGGIEAQEAQGQADFVFSKTLPTDYLRDDKAKGILEAAGVKFGPIVEGDPLFQRVELPSGWKIVPTEHSMWSDLLDDKGRKRAGIFYKAAFYDRSAHIGLDRRFQICHYEGRDDELLVRVKDGDTVIHSVGPEHKPSERSDEWRRHDEMVREAEAWLSEKYPDWKNPGAYWE